MAKLVIEVDTEAVQEVRVTVDGEVVPELPHQFTLSISAGALSGAAHFWQPENRTRYVQTGDTYNLDKPITTSDLELIAKWQERQTLVSKLLKKLPFIKQWMFEMVLMPERPPEKV